MNPPWLDDIKQHIGDSEVNALPEIIGFIEEADPEIDYRVAWCAATARHFSKMAGFDVAGLNLAAISFLDWGVGIAEAIPGCACVFKALPGAGPNDHHVTFMDDDQSDTDDDHIACVGGNQSHMIKRTIYPLACVMEGGFRMPAGYEG